MTEEAIYKTENKLKENLCGTESRAVGIKEMKHYKDGGGYKAWSFWYCSSNVTVNRLRGI